jgi:hypothetical protein
VGGKRVFESMPTGRIYERGVGMSKFEEIKGMKPDAAFNYLNENTVIDGDRLKDHWNWLINRVGELEKENENYKKACASWEAVESYSRKEAQRYKQALDEMRLHAHYPEIIKSVYDELEESE